VRLKITWARRRNGRKSSCCSGAPTKEATIWIVSSSFAGNEEPPGVPVRVVSSSDQCPTIERVSWGVAEGNKRSRSDKCDGRMRFRVEACECHSIGLSGLKREKEKRQATTWKTLPQIARELCNAISKVSEGIRCRHFWVETLGQQRHKRRRSFFVS
jgi:hypothetical protein